MLRRHNKYFIILRLHRDHRRYSDLHFCINRLIAIDYNDWCLPYLCHQLFWSMANLKLNLNFIQKWLNLVSDDHLLDILVCLYVKFKLGLAKCAHCDSSSEQICFISALAKVPKLTKTTHTNYLIAFLVLVQN